MTRLKQIMTAAFMVAMTTQIASAQFNPGRIKALDEAVQGHEHATYQRHAQEQAQILYYRSQTPQPISVTEAKELVASTKKNLTASDAALAKLKAKHMNEPDVVKQIALIEKHHAKAREACGMAEEACAKEHGDHAMIGKCCTDMWHELDAAQVDTKALLKMLKLDNLEPPPKADANAKPAAK